MSKFLKKSRLILSVVLLVQAVTMVFLFILQIAKRRSLAQAFLAVAAFEATAGGYLLWQWTEDEKEKRTQRDLADEMRANPEGFDIPLDEKATEREFR